MYTDDIRYKLIALNKDQSLLDLKEAQRLDTEYGYHFLLDDKFADNIYKTMDHMHLFACFWRIFQFYGFHVLSDELLYYSVKDKEKIKDIPKPLNDRFSFFPQ